MPKKKEKEKLGLSKLRYPQFLIGLQLLLSLPVYFFFFPVSDSHASCNAKNKNKNKNNKNVGFFLLLGKLPFIRHLAKVELSQLGRALNH